MSEPDHLPTEADDPDTLYQPDVLVTGWLNLDLDDVRDPLLGPALRALREEGLGALQGQLPGDINESAGGYLVQVLVNLQMLEFCEEEGVTQPHQRRLVREVRTLTFRTGMAGTTYAERQARRARNPRT